MHPSSWEHMFDIVTRYLLAYKGRKLDILDFGSYDVNGTYRPLFNQPNWNYRGVDVRAGPNVDVVLRHPYDWHEIESCAADLIVSGQTFEHIEFFWLTWLEIARVLRPAGLVFLIAPSRGPEHRHPTDCWRFYPDAYRALAKYGGLEVLEVTTDWPETRPDSMWGDTVGVFRKP